MLKPSKGSLGNFEYQLEEIKRVVTIAEANGHQRILNPNRNAKRRIEAIIEKIKAQ